MSRIAARKRVTRLTVGGPRTRRADFLAVEEPLEIRVAGRPLAVTMRTPGHDVELAAGFLVSEGVIHHPDHFAAAIHCGAPTVGETRSVAPSVLPGPPPGTVGETRSVAPSVLPGPPPGTVGETRSVAPSVLPGPPPGTVGETRSVSPSGLPGPQPGTVGENTYNVLDVALAPGVAPPDPSLERNFYTTSSCGLCGKASIDAVHTASHFTVSEDPSEIDAQTLTGFPEALRAEQAVFERTGGLHAAGLFDAATGELLVVREDVGRHNAVDKVVGWALMHGHIPARGRVLMVSGRASFELTQKALMAGIPTLAAVSAPSSLAVDLAAESGLTLVGFLRGNAMVIYSRDDRVVDRGGADPHPTTSTPASSHPATPNSATDAAAPRTPQKAVAT